MAEANDKYRQSASFRLRMGKYAAGVLAVESAMLPGRFIRHASYILWAHPDDGSQLFKFDASWLPVEREKLQPPTG